MNEESVNPSNISDNESFENVLNSYMSRRALVVGGLAGAALTFFGGAAASAKSNGTVSRSALASQAGTNLLAKAPKISFTSIPLQ